jgi:5-methylcytosine-specific restriction endonuclease McrA
VNRQPKEHNAYRKYKRALEAKYVNTEHGFVTRLIGSIFSRCKGNRLNNNRRSKGWLPRLTKDGIREIYDEQIKKFGKVCLYCGEKFTYKRKTDPDQKSIKQCFTNCSIDRYNPNETYKRGNVVFCCWDCNSKKSTSTKNDWLNFLKGRKKIIK